MSKLFSFNYEHYERYGKMSPKCEFWEMDTERSATKNDGFWLF